MWESTHVAHDKAKFASSVCFLERLSECAVQSAWALEPQQQSEGLSSFDGVMAETALMAWDEHVDEASGRVYHANRDTRETMWTPPGHGELYSLVDGWIQPFCSISVTELFERPLGEPLSPSEACAFPKRLLHCFYNRL